MMAAATLFSSISNSVASSFKFKSIHDRHESRPWESGENFLKILVNPPDANIDVIAIHGLNPLNKQSHAEATWTSEGNLWLSDFLPKRVPQARICLFGYNSNVAFGSSLAGVREQGENILNHLEKIRAENPRRPLVFVCHSLGGLIIKRALVHAKADTTYKQIWESTFGLVFFATPQQGGNHSRFGDVVARIARCVSRNPGNTFMSALKRNSQFLSTITDDFRQMLEDFQIISFYETRPLGPLGVIVDRQSALLGLPGTRERQIPIDADHRSICKFASHEDPMYRLIEDNIVHMITNATSPTSHPDVISPTSHPNVISPTSHPIVISPTSHRLESEKEPCSSIGNTSRITGGANTIIQAGNENRNITNGNENTTNQLGQKNNCEVDGMRNTVTQLSSGTTSILLLVLNLLLNRWVIDDKYSQ